MVDPPESGRITDATGSSSIRGVEGAAYKCGITLHALRLFATATSLKRLKTRGV